MYDYIKWHNDIYIRKGIVGRNNDAWLIVEVINHDEYKLNNLQLKNINTICDIGASIGVFSILAHRHFPNANIICVDPNPNTIELLRLNTENFAKVIEGCVSYDKNVYMVFGSQDYEASVSSNPRELKHKVKPYTLKQIIPEGCDLLKLDCEGAEYDIFEKEDLSNIRYIIGEWHNTIRWFSFLINYIAQNSYWNYTIIQNHDANGSFFMKNLKYE
jgi:FkbM family methyltransferase